MQLEGDFGKKVRFVLRKIRNYHCQNKNKTIIKYLIYFLPKNFTNISSEEECNILKLLEQKGVLQILKRKITNCAIVSVYLVLNLPQFNNLFQEYFFYSKKYEQKVHFKEKQTDSSNYQKTNNTTYLTSYFISSELKILDIILRHYLRDGVICDKDYKCLFAINKILKKINYVAANRQMKGAVKTRNLQKKKSKNRKKSYKKFRFEGSKVQSNVDKNIEHNKTSKIIQPLPITGKIEVQGLSEGLQALKNKNVIESGPKFPYKIPAGTHWNNVIIKFLNDEEIEIYVKKLRHITNYKEMGMIGKGKVPIPNEQWVFLKVLAKCNGEITIRDQEAKDKYKKQKQALTETLRNYFSIDYDPFYPYKSCPEKDGNSYKTKILLIPSQQEEKFSNIIEEETDTFGIQEYLSSTMIEK